MIRNMKIRFPLFFIFLAGISGCNTTQPEGCFPKENLPDYISPLTSFGQRAEWSLDGKKVFFVDSAGGEVWMVDVKSKKTSQVSESNWRPEGWGYYRIMALSDGNYLLTCGPDRRGTVIQIVKGDFSQKPWTLDEPINEGPAISRKDMKIAWTPAQKKIWLGEIVFQNGVPEIENRRVVVDNSDVVADSIKYEGMIEPQSFRPPDEKELIWSQYGKDDHGRFSSEVFGCDLATGKLTNYSKAPNQYDEPEGMFPDGEYTLVECDHHHPEGTAFIDIYKLKLDGTGKHYERLTHFSDTKGYRSSNPVVSDDGKYIAFQASEAGTAAGVGCGLYLFDLQKYAKENPSSAEQ